MSSSGQDYLLAIAEATTADDVVRAVEKAIGDPAVHFYGTLLNTTKVVDALAQASPPKAAEDISTPQRTLTSGATLEALLRLLAYGTIGDWLAASAEVRAFESDSVQQKLRELSLLTFCSQHAAGARALKYAEVQRFLHAPTPTAMEEVVVNAVTDNLIKAHLDPQRQVIYVQDVAAREVQQSDIPALLEKLKTWGAACDVQLSMLDQATARTTRAEVVAAEKLQRL